MKAPNAVGKFIRNQSMHQNNREIVKSNPASTNTQNLRENPKGKKSRRKRGEFHYNNGDYKWASLVY